MFQLSKHQSKIAHLNIRTEKHGEEDVLAADIRVEADVTNDFLSYLSPTLKWSLYDKETRQGSLIDDAGHMPKLRYEHLPELRWTDRMEKAAFTIHGHKKTEDLAIDANIAKLSLLCKEGGTVSIVFQASVLPTPEQSGRLAALLGQEAKVSVREAESQETVGGEDPNAGK